MSRVLLGLFWSRHRLAMGLCCLAPVLIGVMIGFIYPTYSRQREMMKFLRVGIRFFGQEQIDMFSAAGAFTLPFQHPLCLVLLGITMAVPAMAMPAGERGRGALDLLLATPLERGRLVITLAAFQSCAAPILGLAAFVGAFLGAVIAGAAGDLEWLPYAAMALNTTLLAAFIGGVATLISVHAAERSSAMLAFGICIGVFLVIDVVARLWLDGAWLAWLSPYGFSRPARLVAEGPGNIAYARDLLTLGGGAVLLHWSAVRGERRRQTV